VAACRRKIARMSQIREILEGESHLAAPALLELRPDAGPLDTLISRVDVQRGAGYRIVGAFDDGEGEAAAAAVIGFKVAENLVWGRHLYIEDVVTRAEGRGRGHAPALMEWVLDEARRTGCGQVHLNSAVGSARRGAHRFYFNSGLQISAHHFSMELDS
jgi:GNAT superfamily N-acetyltransferase